jgi:hypothetical protein
MPSTYTLNNGIELIATGEQSGTWGDTTNVNLGLIDTALDGQVTITLPAAGSSGSPNALAISDGSASDGRNRLIIFDDGGDLGATAFVQLTPNDAEKIVYIRNNLTGGRAITLFQGTYNASNDYEVPAGTTAVVFFNGGGAGAVAANVFNNAFFDSLRLGGVSVTAILDEDNMASDSATALATQQSIKAYVDAQVGANNELSEVLANGNTSGGNDIQMTTTDEVQFRDTALTISSSVDGQLDIAADVELEIVAPTLDINASTAVTIDTTTMTMTGSVNVVGDLDVDNLNINGNSIISTNTDGNITLDPNGTGSVAVTGPATISGNLTVDTNTLFVDAANNRVGVGTSSPERQVTINSSFPVLQFTNPTTGTTSNDGLLIFQTGLDAYFSNQEAGSTVFETNNTERTRISSTGLLTNQIGAVFNESGADSDFRVESDTNTHMLFVDAGNNRVGVGTATPATTLHIDGGTGQVVQVGPLSLVNFADEGSGVIFGRTSDGALTQAIGTVLVQSLGVFGRENIVLATGGSGLYGNTTERMRIDESGNVGIGTSSIASGGAGTTNLNVHTPSATSVYLKLSNTGTGNTASDGFDLAVDSSANAYIINRENAPLLFSTNNTERTRIDNVGTLIHKLAATFNEDGADDFRVESDLQTHMLFVDASTNRVGINTSSPSQALHVTGNAIADSITLGGNTSTPSLSLTSFGGSRVLLSYDNSTGVTGFTNLYGRIDVAPGSGGTAANGLRIQTTEIAVNDDSTNMDFRVESDTNTHALFVDAGLDKVGIGSSDTAGVAGNGLKITSNSIGSQSAAALALTGTGGDFYSHIIYNSATDYVSYVAISSSGTNSIYDYWTDAGRGFTNISRHGQLSDGSQEYTPTTGAFFVWNQSGEDADFRVESDTNTHLLFVDAATTKRKSA